jgi:exodeoxyribonuclease-3
MSPSFKMKIASFNVNGIRALNRKEDDIHFRQWCTDNEIDIVCFQEIRTSDDKQSRDALGMYRDLFPFSTYNFSRAKKGYSGTAIMSKTEYPSFRDFELVPELEEECRDPLLERCAEEGRLLTIDVGDFYVVNVYTPNLGRGPRRFLWDSLYRRYCLSLNKPLVLCGDFNCAHQEIDVAFPEIACMSSGFTDAERESFSETLVTLDVIDTWRTLQPSKPGYTFWSALGGKKRDNRGWRLDYFLVSESIFDRVRDIAVFKDCRGSDHCPLVLNISSS